MATGAINTEDYSLSEARTGTIRVSRIVLTGWGAAPTASAGLMTFSDHGRLWGVYTASSGDLSLYRRSTAGSGDKVCSGTVSSGVVTLSAANTSGITGTADVDNGTPGTNPDANATFDLIVSYADETDVKRVHAAFDSFLTGTPATYMGLGLTRHEHVLLESKRELDRWIKARHESRLRYDTWGRPLLAHIAQQRDFARCQALIAAYMAAQMRAGLNPQYQELAAFYSKSAWEEFSRISIAFDYERDTRIDDTGKGATLRVFRA